MEENLNSNENLEVEKTTEEIEQDVEISEEDLEVVDEETSKKFKTIAAQKKHWREKYHKLEQEFEEAKKVEPKEEKTEQTVKQPKQEDVDWKSEFQRLELQQGNSDLTKEEIVKAMKYAEVEGKTAQEVIDSSYFKAIVNDRKEQQQTESGTPSPSNRSGSGVVTNYEKVLSNPELMDQMSDKEYLKFVEWKEKRV